MFSAPLAMLKALPDQVDLEPSFSVYDQGHIGSCTANALARAVQFDRLKSNESSFHSIEVVHLLQRTSDRG
jgi:hypothetical protein